MSVYRERDVRYTREHSPSSGEDDKYKTTTVRRYKVSGGGHSGNRVVERDRIERYEEDDDRRSRYTHSNVGRSSGETLEIDRRVERIPERPRSAFDSQDRYEYERERESDRTYYPERRTKVVEEIRETSSPSPRDNYWDRQIRQPWDDPRETDVRVEKRVSRRDSDGLEVEVKEKIVDEHRDEPRDYKEREYRIERRVEERQPREVDIERYRKETEYYAAPTPPPAPVIIRQKAPEQKVVIHEAPAPAPVFLPRQEPTFIVLRNEQREVERRPEPREDDYYRREDRRRRDERQYESDGYDEDYYVKRTIIRRERSSSSDHHKRRHLAEGALAGAGITALLAGRGGKEGDQREHRGRKVLAGAALGALGTEAVRRAKSAYEDRYEDDYDDDYYQHRHRSKSRSRLATGLAIVSFFGWFGL